MSTIKPIIGVIWVTGMYDESIKLLSECNCETFIISNIDQLNSADAIVIPSSIPITLKKYLWEEFISSINQLITSSDIPVWLCWRSVEIFEDTFDLKRRHIISQLDEQILLDFLDSKPYRAKMFNWHTYESSKTLMSYFFPKIKEIWHLSNWDACILNKSNTLITLFSPEFSKDSRIYEYFVNEMI